MPNPLRLATKLALLLSLTAPLASAQGPGGRGGWGGPGGGGTSPTALVQMSIIQDEVKMTDKQKAQIKQIKESADKKRVQVQDNAQKVATAARLQAAQEAAELVEANGGTPVDPNANGNNGGGGGRGGRGNRNDPASQAMRQTMDNFDAEVETALLKAIDAKQRTRVKQIALQAEGAGAFNNPEVIERLALTEEQVAAIDAIRNDSRQAGRQLFGQLFNNGNNNGGPGGGGPGGRPDPATFQTPEFQAKLKTVEDSTKKLDDQTMANVGKALTKAQKATFNRMIGEKFDVSQLRQGMFSRFRPAGTPATPPAAQASAAPAQAPAPTAAATPSATTKPAARKSLRESRGGSSQP